MAVAQKPDSDAPVFMRTPTAAKPIKYGRLKQTHPRLDLARVRVLHALYRGGVNLLGDMPVMDVVFGKIGDESDTLYNERKRRAFYENLFAMVINQISAGLAQDPCRLAQAKPEDISADAQSGSSQLPPGQDDEEDDEEDPSADPEADPSLADDSDEEGDKEETDDYFEDDDVMPPPKPTSLTPIIDAYWTELMENATVRDENGGQERTFDQVMRDICVEALVCGWAWFQVDLPKPTYQVGEVPDAPAPPPRKEPKVEAQPDDGEEQEENAPPRPPAEKDEEDEEDDGSFSISLKDQEDAGDLSAYIATWPTDAITDWEEVDGRVIWLRTYECINLSLTPDQPRWPLKGSQRTHRWTIWDDQGWQRYEIVETQDEPLTKWNDESDVPPAEGGTHTFGCIPWVRFDLITPGTFLHIGDLIESLCRVYFNRTNGESWQWTQNCFQQLYEFLGPEMAGIDTEVSAAQENPNRAQSQRRAPGVVHVRGNEDRAEYVAPQMGGAEAGAKATQDLRDAVLRQTAQMALAQDTSGAMLRRSADSKKQDAVAQEIVLGAVGKRLLIGARRAIKLCAIARGDDPETAPDIEGYARFDVDDASTLINDTVLLDAVQIPSATYQVEQKFRVASAHLGDNVDPEILKQIRAELEGAITQDQLVQAAIPPNPFADEEDPELDEDGNPIPPDDEADPDAPFPPPAQPKKANPFAGKPKKKPWGKGAPARKPAPGHQEKPWSCGPASLVYVCAALGMDVSEKTLREGGDIDEDGTDEEQLIQAAKVVGLREVVHHTGSATQSWETLLADLRDGMPNVLCVDQWDHWVAVIGVVGDRVVVQDPANTADNVEQNGVHLLTREQLLKRWRCKGEEKSLYAVAFRKGRS